MLCLEKYESYFNCTVKAAYISLSSALNVATATFICFFFVCDRRQKFLYDLNTSGKYFAFKEQLKVLNQIVYSFSEECIIRKTRCNERSTTTVSQT